MWNWVKQKSKNEIKPSWKIKRGAENLFTFARQNKFWPSLKHFLVSFVKNRKCFWHFWQLWVGSFVMNLNGIKSIDRNIFNILYHRHLEHLKAITIMFSSHIRIEQYTIAIMSLDCVDRWVIIKRLHIQIPSEEDRNQLASLGSWVV